ncbi:MAG TPA: flagellar hook-length control protein FliK [Jatrophihabitans sp.]|nr:flagellar hook-length control protein FliK [Jatrophihabitans sp.]
MTMPITAAADAAPALPVTGAGEPTDGDTADQFAGVIDDVLPPPGADRRADQDADRGLADNAGNAGNAPADQQATLALLVPFTPVAVALASTTPGPLPVINRSEPSPGDGSDLLISERGGVGRVSGSAAASVSAASAASVSAAASATASATAASTAQTLTAPEGLPTALAAASTTALTPAPAPLPVINRAEPSADDDSDLLINGGSGSVTGSVPASVRASVLPAVPLPGAPSDVQVADIDAQPAAPVPVINKPQPSATDGSALSINERNPANEAVELDAALASMPRPPVAGSSDAPATPGHSVRRPIEAPEGLAAVPTLHIESKPVVAEHPVQVATPVRTPDAQPVLSAALARLRSRADGTHELTVALHPAELGQVDVVAKVRDGVLTVTLSCADDAAHDAVRAALPNLHTDLAQAGFAGVDVTVDNGAAQPDPRAAQGNANSATHASAESARPDTTPVRELRRRPSSNAALDRWL